MEIAHKALIEQGGLPCYIIYNAIPVIGILLYARRNGNRPLKEILNLVLIAIVTVTWTISSLAPEFYYFAFTKAHFSLLYPFIAYLSTAIIIYVYENYNIQKSEKMSTWNVYQMLRIIKYRYSETVFFCFVLTVSTVFLKEVYIMSGKIEISELALMLSQAGEYAGNFIMIFDFIFIGMPFQTSYHHSYSSEFYMVSMLEYLS